MPNCCQVNLCRNGLKNEPNLQCFEFPKTPDIKRRWIKQLKKSPDFEPKRHHRVCSRHFIDSDFLISTSITGKQLKSLKPDAIPTLFLKGETEVVEEAMESQPMKPTTYSGYKHDHSYSSANNDSGHVDVQDLTDIAMEETIEEPMSPNEDLESLVSQLKQQITELQDENKTLKDALSSIFNNDQVTRLLQPESNYTWSPQTLQKGIQLYYICGTSGYECLLEHKFPLPSVRTLQRHLALVDVQPGVHKDLIQLLKMKVDVLPATAKYAALIIDEMSINPGTYTLVIFQI